MHIPLPVILTGLCVAGFSLPVVAAEQDCAPGSNVREVYAVDRVGGGDLGMRLHFCILNAADGVRQLTLARAQVAADPIITPTMRAELLRQLDAEIARLRQR